MFTSYNDDDHGGDTNAGVFKPQAGDWDSLFLEPGSNVGLVNSTILYATDGIDYTAGNVSSLTISGSTVSHSMYIGVYGGESDSISITGSTVSYNGWVGIYSGSSNGTFADNTVNNNGWNGIEFWGNNNSFTGNTISYNGDDGIEVWGNNNSFTGNTISYNGDDGIEVAGSGNVLTGNKITNNTSGIDLREGGVYQNDGNNVSSNTISYNGQVGIWLGGTNSILTGNTVSYNGPPAPADDVCLPIPCAQPAGIVLHDPYNYGISASIHYNDIFGNASYGISSNVSLDATQNYWGSRYGPEPYGSGNGVNGPVIVNPWSQGPNTQAGAAFAATLGMNDHCSTMCGDPINMSTGNYVYEHEDIKIPTKGLPLEFKRTYNSIDGWSNTWQISVSPRANGDVVVLREDGRQDTFVKNPDNSYAPPPGRHDTLVKNADGTYKLITSDQTTYNFGPDNQLISAVSETGQATTLTYDANNHLTMVTEPTGRTLSFRYNADNRIDEITDPGGNTVSFLYSPAGDLTQVTDQNGGVTNYAYDANHHITSITDPNGHTSANNTYDAYGRVISQTDAEGHLLSFAYDPANKKTTMTRQMDPNDSSKDEVLQFYYDSLFRTTKETDALGRDTLYNYDAAGNRDSVTDRRGTVTKKTFDTKGNVTDIYKAYGAPEQQHTSFTYNAKNHPLTKTDAANRTTTYTYDASNTYLQQVGYPTVTDYDGATHGYTEAFSYNADGTKASFKDKNGDVTGYAYDSYGNLTAENRNTNRPASDQVTIGYSYDSLGRKTSESDGNGRTATFDYDNLGQLRHITRQVTDPGTQQLVDVVTEYQYDAAGNKTAEIDPEGKITAFAYDNMNHLTQITDAKLNMIQYTYDAAFNKTELKDKNGNVSHFTFDKDNRNTSATDPENNTTTYGYDSEGNQISVTNANGKTSTRSYDKINRVIASTEPDEGGATRTTGYAYNVLDHLISATDPLNHTTAYAYDELGRLKQLTDAKGNPSYFAYDGQGNKVKDRDANGNVTTFAFSPNDFLTSVTDPMGSVTSYAYDKVGNRTQQTDAEGRISLYGYDELNRLKEEKVDAGQGNWLLQKSYAYDKDGHPLRDTTTQGTVTRSYDDVYNLTGVTDRQGAAYSYTYDPNGNQLTATEAASGKTVSFAYSPRGLVSAAIDAHGLTESFTFDPAGNLTERKETAGSQSFSTSYAYTPRNQQKSVTRGPDTTTFTYDGAGNLANKTYANGLVTTYSYDEKNQLTSQNLTQNLLQPISSYTQAYDKNGNVTSLRDIEAIPPPSGPSAFINTYAYDALNRLTSEEISGYGTVSYTYDRTGNRLALDNPTTGQTSYGYNQANQLTASVNGGTTTNYSYNANGVLTQKTTGANITSYSYNGLDKLTGVTTPTTTVNYAYDALGRRISRTEGANTKNFHLNGASDLEDYQTDAYGNLVSSANRGPDGLISETDRTGQSPVTSYKFFNPHGDTAAASDDTGAITQTDRYDAFGNELSGNSPRNGYTGKWQREFDNATDTIRMGVREYQPALGRFSSADPLKGNLNDPQTGNRYEYSLNNPLRYYDINGFYPGESYVNWLTEKISDTSDFTHRPEFTLFTGYIPPEKRLLHDNEFVQLFNNPAIETGILAGLGLPGGGFGSMGRVSPYSVEMESFYGGSRAAAGGGRGATCATELGAAGRLSDALSGLPTGSSFRIKLVNSTDELEDLFYRLSDGGSPVGGRRIRASSLGSQTKPRSVYAVIQPLVGQR